MPPIPHRSWTIWTGLTILIPAILAMALVSIPTLLSGAPGPVIEDEWGYLLSADTFNEGRLTNPTHEHWQLFEAVHQMHTPSYQSKYPPGQALLLALGQKVWHPILGVWLGVGLMIGSIVWMLLAITSPRWALLGGLLATIQYCLLGVPFGGGTFAYWGQSYWGGALAAAGGAMVLGAFPRMVRRPRVTVSIILAVGLLILANTRPMEGMLAALPVGVLLLGWIIYHRFSPKLLGQVVLPILVVLGVGFAGMGKYNKSVTGDSMEMPWNTHYEQYCVFPLFIWQDLLPDKEWRNTEMARFHGEEEAAMLTRHKSAKGLATNTAKKLARFGVFYAGPLLLLPLLIFFLPMLRIGWVRFAIVPLGLVILSGLVKFGSPPHYSAPIAGVMVALIVQSLRGLNDFKLKGKPIGKTLFQLCLLGMLGFAAFGIKKSIDNIHATQAEHRYIAQEQLEAKEGQHLVLVRFGPEHGSGNHWIWNAANIDASKVVWARDPGPENRPALLEYFKGRKVWRADVAFTEEQPVLTPYVDGTD